MKKEKKIVYPVRIREDWYECLTYLAERACRERGDFTSIADVIREAIWESYDFDDIRAEMKRERKS